MDLNVIIRKRSVQVGAAAAVLLAVAISLAVMSASPGGSGEIPAALVAGDSAQEGTLTAAGNVTGSEQERLAAEQESSAANGNSPSEPTPPSPGTGSTTDDSAENPTALVKRVRIMWWNDTENTPLTGALVSIGTSSWSPNESAASDVGALSVAVGKSSILLVYPDGPGGARIEVPILFQKMMKDDSEQDAIIVEVSDKFVRVLGNPVDNVDQTFDRF